MVTIESLAADAVAAADLWLEAHAEVEYATVAQYWGDPPIPLPRLMDAVFAEMDAREQMFNLWRAMRSVRRGVDDIAALERIGERRGFSGRSDPGMTEEGFQRMVLGDEFYETGADDD